LNRIKVKGSEDMGEFSADKMSSGDRARIVGLAHTGDMRRRMLEIGFLCGGEIECVGASPLGDPKAYLVKGAVFAIRRRDAGRIIVESIR